MPSITCLETSACVLKFLPSGPRILEVCPEEKTIVTKAPRGRIAIFRRLTNRILGTQALGSSQVNSRDVSRASGRRQRDEMARPSRGAMSDFILESQWAGVPEIRSGILLRLFEFERATRSTHM